MPRRRHAAALAICLFVGGLALTPARQESPQVAPPTELAMASIPTPRHGGQDVSLLNTRLRWIAGRNAISHNLYFGTSTPPRFRGNQSGTSFDPGPLDTATSYFWRVDTERPGGVAGAARPSTTPSIAPQPIAWGRCLDQPSAWYASDEAMRIADLVRLYQRKTGGWPKNTDMARPMDATERRQVEASKDDTDSTIDNDATTTQLLFLARVHSATHTDRVQAAFLAGLDYLLAAQYPNGGWPQYFPLRADYSRRVTFNDDAMVHVMEVLRDAAAGRAPYAFVDRGRRERAADAVARGVRLILAAQIRVQGRLTAWCAQHDEVTLDPRQARTYEHPSLSGRESVGIASFLMSVPDPDAAVVAAVDAAVAWLRGVRLEGLRVEDRPDASLPGGFDRVVVKDRAATPMWARFYEIGTNRPIFSGRDSVIRYDMAEIEHERRVNYSWYGSWAAAILDTEYPAWKRKHSR